MNNGANKIAVMLAVIMSILISSGCATTAELRKLSIGMDKKEVVNILGEPKSTRASTRTSGPVEIWDYSFAKTALGFPPFIRDTYWLFFKEDRLSQWGEENDWGKSAKDPDHVEKIIIDNQTGKKDPRFP
jgi:outer membrane protein assembly factor BamE (lipoprotein component of BamABCDE complex)